MIRTGSRSFYAASLLLPKPVRNAAYAIYAFCRYSDDVIDLGAGDAQAVRDLQRRLDRAYDGDPCPTAVDRAFCRVVREYAIPKTLPAALLEGLAWDAEGRRYETIDALYDYAARVAGSVGAMMSVLMGARSKNAIARAGDLGVAMQLTNIARDVGEDARAGRIYLPISWLEDAGVDIDGWLAAPVPTAAVSAVTRRLLTTAEDYYERGLAGVDYLPVRCRAGIVAAADIYADIGRVIAANNYDSVSSRAVVSTRRKLMMLAHALASPNFAYASAADAPLDANVFLVDAVAETEGSQAPLEATTSAAAGVLDLIIRLERRDRANALGGANL
ncbi:MAG: phytoene/squalene synthase family protein [Hyphococcus sp.]